MNATVTQSRAVSTVPALEGAAIVILQSCAGRRQTKLLKSDGTVDAQEMENRFNAARLPLDGLQSLQQHLEGGLRISTRFAVRGDLVGQQASAKNILRRTRTRENEPATLRDCGRLWLAVDMDDISLPPDVKAYDLVSCGKVAIAMLPSEFWDVDVIVQASGSHGIKPGARLRLWFWLSRSITCLEARSWLAQSPVDHSLFQAGQPIFTAPPVREDGRCDHLPRRIVRLPGRACVEVPAITAPGPRKVEAAPPVPLRGDAMDAVASIMAALPNRASRSQWLAVGHGIAASYAADLELGRDVWLDWTSRRDGETDLDRDEATWESIKDGEHLHGIELLLDMARRAGIDPRDHGYRGPGYQDAVDEFEADEGVPGGAVTLSPGGAVAPATVVVPQLISEDRLADEWSRAHLQQFINCGGKWLRRSGHVYVDDQCNSVMNAVRRFSRSVSDILHSGDQDRAAERVGAAKTIKSVLALAASDPRHAVAIDDMDGDPMELNTPTGVVDLRTGSLRRHDATDRFRKTTPVGPGGDCPRWLAFLDQATRGDAEYIEYLQRWSGYFLTGVIREHALPCLSGSGGNGKGVLLGTLQELLGAYAATAAPELITDDGRGQHLTNIARLQGARLCVIPETDEGKAWHESRLKLLTGGDRLSANFMHKDLFEFDPTAKLVVSTNHRPPLKNPDAAMKRRLHILPFTFTPPAPDLYLRDALRAELGGILQWAIAGTRAWNDRGLAMPAVVKAATDAYFTDQDTLGAWIAECTAPDPDGAVPVGKAFTNWANFAAARHEAPRTMKMVVAGSVWQGVRQKEDRCRNGFPRRKADRARRRLSAGLSRPSDWRFVGDA